MLCFTTLRNSSKNSILKIIFGSLLTILIISFGMWGTEDLVGWKQLPLLLLKN